MHGIIHIIGIISKLDNISAGIVISTDFKQVFTDLRKSIINQGKS